MYKKRDVFYCKISRPNQKPEYYCLGKDKKMAKAIEAKIRAEIHEGNFFTKKRGEYLTIRQLLEWYETKVSQMRVKKGKKKQETLDNEKYLINNLNKLVGDLFISQVTVDVLEGYEMKRFKDQVSSITIHHELRYLKGAFQWAVDRWDLIEKSPFLKYDLPEGDKQRIRYLEPREEKKLHHALSQPHNRMIHQFVTIFHETLIRPIDLCKLDLPQLNMKERFIHLGKTKNGEPNLVPLSNNAFRMFKEVLEDRKTQKVLNLKFTKRVFLKNGKPINTNIVGKMFRKVVRKEAQIEDFRLYDLKHDRMTRERRRGATLSDLAEIAGQEDIRSTRRYAHQHLTTKRRIVNKFEPLFSEPGNATG